MAGRRPKPIELLQATAAFRAHRHAARQAERGRAELARDAAAARAQAAIDAARAELADWTGGGPLARAWRALIYRRERP